MAFTIAQVSDAHLGARTPLFRANFDRLVAALAPERPDRVVASGDVSLDGAGVEADFALAAEYHARFGVPVHAIPGNHDVGDHPDWMPQQPIDDARLDRFRRHFGPDSWVIDRENWRILGLNTQTMGAHAEQAAQLAMIHQAIETLEGRLLAVFLHKPLFVHRPGDTVRDYWSVMPDDRRAMAALLEHPALRLVGSGHLHLYQEVERGGVRYAWAPPTSFLVAESEQPGLPGERRLGALVHRFDEGSVTTRLLEPPDMDRVFIHEIQPRLYGG